jgi:hypothetical protein
LGAGKIPGDLTSPDRLLLRTYGAPILDKLHAFGTETLSRWHSNLESPSYQHAVTHNEKAVTQDLRKKYFKQQANISLNCPKNF